jgi:hypothetical protein
LVPILAVPLGMSVRYLGAQIAMDLKTTDQCSQISQTIGFYCHKALKYHLTVDQAVSLFNTYLMAKLELGLQFCFALSQSRETVGLFVGQGNINARWLTSSHEV